MLQIKSFDPSFIKEVSGKMGDIIIKKTPTGKHIISRLGQRDLQRHPVTQREKANQKLFAEATHIAHEIFNDPEQRAVYEQRWLNEDAGKTLYGFIFSLTYKSVKQEYASILEKGGYNDN